MFKISASQEEIASLPLGSFGGEINVITSEGREFSAAISYLSKQKVLGFDTETRPVFEPHKPHKHVALLQISGPDKAYLFRVFKLGMPRELCAILSNPDILKVGAACHDDLRGLQHYAKFQSRSVVDLQKIAWEWGIRDKSVKKLAAIILGVRISKAQQLSNWEADTLAAPQQLYAATDAWVCLEMYNRLLKEPRRPLTREQMFPPQPQPRPQEQPKEQEQQPKAAESENKNDQ